MVFGRVAEEAEALCAASVPYEIVPGVSSALAAPAYAGIPLTHRAYASSVSILTGHCVRAGARPAAALAAADTLVVLHGAMGLASLAAELVAAGRRPETPAAFISRATWDSQQVVVATLSTLADAVERSRLGAPAVVVGEVVALRERLELVRGSPYGDISVVRKDHSYGFASIKSERNDSVLYGFISFPSVS